MYKDYMINTAYSPVDADLGQIGTTPITSASAVRRSCYTGTHRIAAEKVLADHNFWRELPGKIFDRAYTVVTDLVPGTHHGRTGSNRSLPVSTFSHPYQYGTQYDVLRTRTISAGTHKQTFFDI